MAKLLCITCGQSIPEGAEYPFFIGQMHLSPDLTNVDEAADELASILGYIEALSSTIQSGVDVSDTTLQDLASLVRDLTKEAKRRMEWLHDAGKAVTRPAPDREGTTEQ